jgi:hypothetical protein
LFIYVLISFNDEKYFEVLNSGDVYQMDVNSIEYTLPFGAICLEASLFSYEEVVLYT